jgi:hypothetical protein
MSLRVQLRHDTNHTNFFDFNSTGTLRSRLPPEKVKEFGPEADIATTMLPSARLL